MRKCRKSFENSIWSEKCEFLLKKHVKLFFFSEASAKINKSRLLKMDARNKCMRKIFGEAQYKIFEKIMTDRPYYKALLEKLVAQVIDCLFFFLFFLF